ncbi:hypothetical protein BDN72DRAFT_842989 [Pluteus cervinus]|uniref:Uncharacterized protein n=1 Tax=Pluteus cervinus TaxID=181527 RepID=A0ACD3AQD3_9AGAR|nr:hypothetical protein BDN72DRAFT_842989 [Pluteus cervinus]
MTSAGAESLHFYDPHMSKRTQIEHQIHLLQQQIRKLQTECNALLPISTLPNEILSYIFLLCRGHDSFSKINMLALLCLTWTCQHWRTVALSDASLWAYIGDENLRWVRECLRRSKEVPLEGVLRIGPSSPLSDGTLVSSLMYRFRRLHVCTWSGSRGDLLMQPAPLLESLTLDGVTIQAPLFSGISPLLHTVCLCRCSVTLWTCNTLPFAYLNRLTLISCVGIPVDTLVQSFRPTLPNLESLVLDSSLARSPAIITPLSPRLYFPKLKELRIWSSDASPVADFFESCSFVPSTTVNVAVCGADGETHQQSDRGYVGVYSHTSPIPRS